MKQNNKSDSALQRTAQWVATHCLSSMGKGMLFAIGFFGTTILAVAISGTIKTWTTGEVLRSSDLNTTITSLKTAIEGIPNWTKAANGNDAYYTAGNVGIGTASPSSLLEAQASGTNGVATIKIAGGSSGFSELYFSQNVSNSNVPFIQANHSNGNLILGTLGQVRMLISSSGSISIGNNVTPIQTLTVNGNAGNTTGVWVNNSDERLKKNIQPLGNFLEKLTELRPVTFEWKDHKKLNAKEGKHNSACIRQRIALAKAYLRAGENEKAELCFQKALGTARMFSPSIQTTQMLQTEWRLARETMES